MNRWLIAAAFAVLGSSTALADTTIRWLHITTNDVERALLEGAAKQYEADHPGITIETQLLENEAFKAKLTTLLQSPDAPDIFFSWGGGVLTEQAKSGVLRPVENVVSDATSDAIGTAGMSAFTRDGHLYGLARDVSEVVLWYNKALFKKAGVDPASMATWEGFLAGIKKFEAAGITPLALGGKDRWPAHFWLAKMIVRLAGEDEYNKASAGEASFTDPPFVAAAQKLYDLGQLHPFQEGFEATTYDNAAGVFGDQKAAMHLMGDWDYANQARNAADKIGVTDENLGILPFPTVEGGMGDPTDTLGGLSGWLFSKNASDEAVKFIEWYNTSCDVQSEFAAGAFYIPIAKGCADNMTDQFKKQIAVDINQAHWHALFFDQDLGPDVGGVVNDMAEELAAGSITPEDAMAELQAAAEDAR